VLPAIGLLWPLSQLIPSPEIAWGDGKAAAGARWELVPIHYSFGLRAPRTRFHAFFIPPPAYFTGSVEIVASPEYVPAPRDASGWIGRLGIRATLPLVDRGETLAISVGVSEYLNDGRPRTAFDVGLMTLFGTCGVRATISPGLAERQTIITLVLRFF
jgi:hypothetical protein